MKRQQLILTTAFTLLAALILLPTSSLPAQPPTKDFTDPLEKEMDELFEKLRREGDPSVPKNRNRIHEMSPDEFEEFQRRFLERFFEDDGPIADDMRESMEKTRSALQRRAMEIRNRQIGIYERQNESELLQYTPVVQTARISIVSVKADDKPVALGTVIDTRGGILTKLSELKDAKKIRCVFSNGQVYDAELIGKNKAYDLAMLYIGGVTTVPIEWVEQPADVGTTLITANQTGKPLKVGTLSVPPRSLVGKDLAFLGVGPGSNALGAVILSVEGDSAAKRAGLQVGDIITTLDDVPIKGITSLVNSIRAHAPGDTVEIAYIRDGVARKTQAILDSASMGGDRELRIQLMNRMGAIPSKRADELPYVLQHDSPLFPEECGGPLVNLDGKAVALNIARGGRVDSYAIPANRVRQLVQELKASQN